MLKAVERLRPGLRPGQPLSGSLLEVWEGLRGTSSSVAAEERSGHSTGGGSGGVSGGSGGSSSSEQSTPERVAKVVAHQFHRAPRDTAHALLRELSELDRIHLVLALQRHTNTAKLEQQERHYVDDLMKQVKHSSQQQHNKLTRQQIHSAVIYQRMLQKFSSVSDTPPTWRQLFAVGLASGIPFVAFGFLDNGIMLVAGEQIDHLFGAKLGLSMLASAGLGNMVADVVGVSATHTIQENMKRFKFARPPRLSILQQQLGHYKAAQFVGAALGVAIGCLMGMSPLAFMEPGFFVSSAEVAATSAAVLGDATQAADAMAQAAEAAAAVLPATPTDAAAPAAAAAAAAPAASSGSRL